MTLLRALGLPLGFTVVAVVACGGGDGSSGDLFTASATGSGTTTASGSATGSTSASATGSGAASASATGGGSATASSSGGGGGATSSSTSSGSGGFDVNNVPSTLGNFTTQGTAACTVPGATTDVQHLSLMVDGELRTATVFVPPSYDPNKAYPIVFVFHGDGGDGDGIRSALDLEPDASGEAIFAYPDGANQTWDDAMDNNQDMDLVMGLRDQLRASYCVDMNRTFLTGMSRGGYFTNQLACRYGRAEFAAIAPHSSTIDPMSNNAYVFGPPNPNGGPYQEDGNYDFLCPSDGAPSDPPPPLKLPPAAMVIHGECDQEGGVEFPRGRAVVEHWGFAAQCTTTPAVVLTNDPNPTCNGGQLTSDPTLAVDPCYVAPGCASGHDVVFCAIPSMDHRVWADAHARIWSFFAAH